MRAHLRTHSYAYEIRARAWRAIGTPIARTPKHVVEYQCDSFIPQSSSAAGARPERPSSDFPLLSSPAQRELPQKEPPPLYRAAPRTRSSPRNRRVLPPSIEQPRAAGAPLSHCSQSGRSSLQRERALLQKEPRLVRVLVKWTDGPDRWHIRTAPTCRCTIDERPQPMGTVH